jgi:hypothetical protein
MYSDLTIACGGKRYPVHRALLATRSSFFEGACRNSFVEAQTGVIDLSEDDAEAVEHMVHCKQEGVVPFALQHKLTLFCRLLPHGLFEQGTISSLVTTLFAGEFAISTLRSAGCTEKTELCAHGRSAIGHHGRKQQLHATDAAR